MPLNCGGRFCKISAEEFHENLLSAHIVCPPTPTLYAPLWRRGVMSQAVIARERSMRPRQSHGKERLPRHKPEICECQRRGIMSSGAGRDGTMGQTGWVYTRIMCPDVPYALGMTSFDPSTSSGQAPAQDERAAGRRWQTGVKRLLRQEEAQPVHTSTSSAQIARAH